MGANAQTSVPTFTAGDVLTAANMNISARTGVPVFADTIARDAAFGGSGEKTLAEGQLCYLESTDVVQYYNGTSWATLAPTSSGLTYITGATFTAAATISMPSSTFTSTYQNYLVMLNVTATSADQNIGLRVNNAGTARTAANYRGSNLFASAAGASFASGDNDATSHRVGNIATANPVYTAAISVFDPVSATTRTSWSCTFTGNLTTATSAPGSGVSGCFYNVTEANDGLTFFVTGTITGTYKVYGYSNS